MNRRYAFSVPTTWRVCCHFVMNAAKNCKIFGVFKPMRKHNMLKSNYRWKRLSDRTKNLLIKFWPNKEGRSCGCCRIKIWMYPWSQICFTVL